jgi:hypothetical protein
MSGSSNTLSTSTSTNLRPFTNNDITNTIAYKHGLPRPMKWMYRLGKLNTVSLNTVVPDQYQVTNNNRYVSSSKTVPLIALTMDRPGHTIESFNTNTTVLDTCLTPSDNLMTTDCCQAGYALQRIRGPSTVLNKTEQKYYPTQQQYMRSRGKTLKQNSFHYTNADTEECDNKKLGAPIFNPSNAQFAQQGGVSSSSRTTRLTLNTVRTAVNNSIAQPVHKTFDTCRTGLPVGMRASQRCR